MGIFCKNIMITKSLRRVTTRLSSNQITKGFLSYGEIFIKGKQRRKFFLSTYIYHPSLANNETSGPVVTTFLVKWIKVLIILLLQDCICSRDNWVYKLHI